MTEKNMKNFVSHLKNVGFVFPGSEIYGGLANSWDYGPLGVNLKNNIIRLWRKDFITKDISMVEIDSKILMNPRIWVATKHVDTFTDVLIENKINKKRYRLDHLIMAFDSTIQITQLSLKEQEEFVKNRITKWDNSPCEWSSAKHFNLLFETSQGIIENKKSKIYLRPETAQGIFVNFQNIQRSLRLKVPFGVGQIGKAFRNEVTPGNFIFRTREFEQMEIEYFVEPNSENEQYNYFLDKMKNFILKLGAKKTEIRIIEHKKEDLAHYSSKTHDIEYLFPFGWSELVGLALRSDFDLKTHELNSGENLKYQDPQTGKKYWPHVIEPSMGLDRLMLMIMWSAFEIEELENNKERIILKLNYDLAPYKVAILPLVKKLRDGAKAILNDLIDKNIPLLYDETGSIGKRYRRQDSIGTPFCITFDYDSINDKKVTLRFRDSMNQKRILITDIVKEINATNKW